MGFPVPGDDNAYFDRNPEETEASIRSRPLASVAPRFIVGYVLLAFFTFADFILMGQLDANFVGVLSAFGLGLGSLVAILKAHPLDFRRWIAFAMSSTIAMAIPGLYIYLGYAFRAGPLVAPAVAVGSIGALVIGGLLLPILDSRLKDATVRAFGLWRARRAPPQPFALPYPQQHHAIPPPPADPHAAPGYMQPMSPQYGQPAPYHHAPTQGAQANPFATDPRNGTGRPGGDASR